MSNPSGSKGLVAYKSPIVLRRVAEEVPEPYRSALLIHADLKLKREDLFSAMLSDVTNDYDTVRIKGTVVPAKAVPTLLSYLRGYLSRVQSEWLFPLPADPLRPANVGVAKRYLDGIVNGGEFSSTSHPKDLA